MKNELYAIEDAMREVKYSYLYKKKNDAEKKKLLDRVSLVFHLIILLNRDKQDLEKYQMVEIHSKELNKVVGYKHKEVINLLEELGYIIVEKEVNLYHAIRSTERTGINKGTHPRRFGLSDKSKKQGVIKVEFQSENTEARSLNYFPIFCSRFHVKTNPTPLVSMALF